MTAYPRPRIATYEYTMSEAQPPESVALETRETYKYQIPERLKERPKLGASPYYDPTNFTRGDWRHGAGWTTHSTKPKIEHADAVPINSDQLVRDLADAQQGDLIFVPGWAEMNMTGKRNIRVGAPNVTLASDRGAFSEGALLYSLEPTGGSDRVLFDIRQKGFRMHGLRLIGCQPENTKWEGYGVNKPSTGVAVDADDVEIDNCVIRAWGHAAIQVGEYGYVDKTHIHHNDLVDNPMGALGYGVSVFSGNPLIQYNYFDWNRHSIAGDGFSNCAYIARYNLFGPRTVLHVIDMHSAAEVAGGETHAGRRFSVHHNEIMATENPITGTPREAFRARDVPIEGGEVVENRFHHPRDRFSEDGPGKSGDAILQTRYKKSQPSSFAAGKINVQGNYSTDAENLDEKLGIPNFE